VSPLKYIIFVERKKNKAMLIVLKLYTRIYNYPDDIILYNNKESLVLIKLVRMIGLNAI